MAIKRTIKRFFLTLMWLGVAVAMFMVVSAAIKVQGSHVCEGYKISISGFDPKNLFTSNENIETLLKEATQSNIVGLRINSFNLPGIEDLLEQSAWVYNAELYFDNNNVLRVNITEREPLARIFTNAGTSFYIDAAGKNIPLSEKISLDVPVFTGFPVKKAFNVADSAMLQNVIATASFINNDSFWSSQVAEININSCGPDCWNMEMVPVVGNHRVGLGDGSDIVSKFHRLYLFYDQVLKRVGFDKYQKLDVQYNGQIIGERGSSTRIDSIQLRKNIEDLLHQSRKLNTLMEETPVSAFVKYDPVDSSAFEGQMAGMDSVVTKPAPTVVVENRPRAIALPVSEKKKKEGQDMNVSSVVKKDAEKKAAPEPIVKKDTRAVAAEKTHPPKAIAAKPPEEKHTDKKENARVGTPKSPVAKAPLTKVSESPAPVKPVLAKPVEKKASSKETKPATTKAPVTPEKKVEQKAFKPEPPAARHTVGTANHSPAPHKTTSPVSAEKKVAADGKKVAAPTTPSKKTNADGTKNLPAVQKKTEKKETEQKPKAIMKKIEN